MWAFVLWKRFSPETAPRIVQLTITFLLFLSSAINPFIYAARSRVFREEFRKLLCWWKVRRTTTKTDSDASGKRDSGGEITLTVVYVFVVATYRKFNIVLEQCKQLRNSGTCGISAQPQH